MAAGAGVLVLGGCIGSIERDDFDDEVRGRGGGLDGGLLTDAVDAIEADLGVDELRVQSFEVRPGYVIVQVQVPADPEALDVYRFGSSGLYGGRGLTGPTPVPRRADAPPLDGLVFAPEDAGLDAFDDMVDEALEVAELDGGYATDAAVRQAPSGDIGPVTGVTVTDDRSTVVVTFSADGTVVERAQR
ncbi:MAG: hypothetical protein JXA83_13310 [Acidimicrobiales bacterium]|nr:hypothetical protein [Acidimicrobiales bacterium]